MHRLLGMIAVHHCWATPGLYEVQKLIGVVLVTSKVGSQLASQSSTGTDGMHRVLYMTAVHHCWVTAGLYEVQKLIVVYSVSS